MRIPVNIEPQATICPRSRVVNTDTGSGDDAMPIDPPTPLDRELRISDQVDPIEVTIDRERLRELRRTRSEIGFVQSIRSDLYRTMGSHAVDPVGGFERPDEARRGLVDLACHRPATSRHR